jgi:hypothetical protein
MQRTSRQCKQPVRPRPERATAPSHCLRSHIVLMALPWAWVVLAALTWYPWDGMDAEDRGRTCALAIILFVVSALLVGIASFIAVAQSKLSVRAFLQTNSALICAIIGCVLWLLWSGIYALVGTP